MRIVKWIAYNLVGLCVGGYGIWCVLSQKAWIPAGRGKGMALVSGQPAITGGTCYLLLSLFIYISSDWRERAMLKRFRIAALIVIGALFAWLVLHGPPSAKSG